MNRRYTSKYFDGDRGGNRVEIQFTSDAHKNLSESSHISNLHALWDYGVGVLDDVPEVFAKYPWITAIKFAVTSLSALADLPSPPRDHGS